ncbi:MAG: DUF202 domain-containing protein [Candidatus Limnocylindrales bacterium]
MTDRTLDATGNAVASVPPSTGRVDPDSRARTHLANERTFLAWFRTGLTLMALGLAASQLLNQDVAGGTAMVRAMSVAVIAAGVLMVIVGQYRYGHGRAQIDATDFRPAKTSIVIAAIAAVIVGLLAILFLSFVPIR